LRQVLGYRKRCLRFQSGRDWLCSNCSSSSTVTKIGVVN
jgi:hypothetical protein